MNDLTGYLDATLCNSANSDQKFAIVPRRGLPFPPPSSTPIPIFSIYWEHNGAHKVLTPQNTHSVGSRENTRYLSLSDPYSDVDLNRKFEWLDTELIRMHNTDLCLAVYQSNNWDANPIILSSCDSISAQKWKKVGNQLAWKGTNKCMHVQGFEYTLVIMQCDSRDSNQFFIAPHPPTFALLAASNVDQMVTFDSANVPAKLFRTANGNGAYNTPGIGGGQLFEWLYGDLIRWVGTELCLTVADGGRWSGNHIIAFPCSPDNAMDPNQQWETASNFRIRWRGTDFCMSILRFDSLGLAYCMDDEESLQFILHQFITFPAGSYRIQNEFGSSALEMSLSMSGSVVTKTSSRNTAIADTVALTQLFEWVDGKLIRWVGTNWCIAVTKANGVTSGISASVCNSFDPLQQWMYTSTGQLQLKYDTICMVFRYQEITAAGCSLNYGRVIIEPEYPAFTIHWNGYPSEVLVYSDEQDKLGIRFTSVIHYRESVLHFVWKDEQLRLLYRDSCLTVDGGDISVSPCRQADPAQQWTKVGYFLQWKGGNNKCMTKEADLPELHNCYSADDQQQFLFVTSPPGSSFNPLSIRSEFVVDERNGLQYRSLDVVNPYNTTSDCQGTSNYLRLPDGGWQVAPKNEDSAAIIKKYPWGAQAMVVFGGSAYYTALSSAPGSIAIDSPPGHWGVLQSTGMGGIHRWSVSRCDIPMRILLVRDLSGQRWPMVSTEIPNTVVFKKNYYRTLDNISPTSPYWDRDYVSVAMELPTGWVIASNNEDSLSVIKAFKWGTSLMVLKDGNAFWTGPETRWGTSGVLQQIVQNGVNKYVASGMRILLTKQA